MRSNINKITVILSVLILCSLLVGSSRDINDKNKVILANGEWEPYFSERLKNYGVVSHIIKEAFALEGVKVEWVFRPWKRGMEESAKGKWNGTEGWGKKPEWLKLFVYSDQPVMKTTTVAFHRKDKPIKLDKVLDLQGLDVSGTVGYFYGKELEKAEKDGVIKINRGPEDKLNFKKLMSKRTDVVLNDLDVGYEIINNIFPPDEAKLITHHSMVLDSFDCYLLLTKKLNENKRFMKLFDKGYEHLKKSGKVERYWEDSHKGMYKPKPQKKKKE